MTPLRSWALVAVATATMAVSYLDRQVMAALAPTLTAELGIGEATFGLLASAFSVSYLLGAIPSGLLLDRVGARRALPVAVVVWSAVSAAHGFAVGPASLFGLRVLLGAAESPSFPAAAQTLSRALPPNRREAAAGVLFTGSSLGGMVAALIVPKLAAAYGWRSAFALVAVAGLAWLPAWWLATRGVPDLDRPPPTEQQRGSFVDLLALPATRRALIAVVGSAPVIGVVLQWGAKLIVARHGVSPEDVGPYLAVPPLAFDLGAVGIGVLASRSRRGDVNSPWPWRWFGLSAVALAAIGLVGSAPTPWATVAVLSVAIAGGGGVYTLCTAELLARVPADRAAAAGSLTASAQSVSLIATLPVVGLLLDQTHDWRVVGVFLVVLALPAAAIWLALAPREAKAQGV